MAAGLTNHLEIPFELLSYKNWSNTLSSTKATGRPHTRSLLIQQCSDEDEPAMSHEALQKWAVNIPDD